MATLSFLLSPISFAQTLGSAPPVPVPNIISWGGPLAVEDSPTLEQQLQQDIIDWDPRVLYQKPNGSFDYNIEYFRAQLLKEIDVPPEMEPEDAQWEKIGDDVTAQAARIAREMFNNLDRSTFELGVSTLLKVLRNLEIDSTVQQSRWERFVDLLNPEYAAAKNLPQKEGVRIERSSFQDFRALFEKYGSSELRNMIITIARDPNSDSDGPSAQLRVLIDLVGAREVVKEISGNHLLNMEIPGFVRVEFNVKDDIPFVRFVHFLSKKSITVYSKDRFVQIFTKHFRQIKGRQHYMSGEEDQYGRKMGRDNVVVIEQDGKVWSVIEAPKPTTFADRIHNYFYNHRQELHTRLYLVDPDTRIPGNGTTIGDNFRSYRGAIVKGSSPWRFAFGLAIGTVQAKTTFWMAKMAMDMHPGEMAMVQLLAGVLIGANLPTVQNWSSLGALRQVSYANRDWRQEKRFFKRFGKRLAAIALEPTATSRYARSLSVGVAVALCMMAVNFQNDIDLLSISGLQSTAVLFGGTLLWKLMANMVASNKGKTALEELLRFARSRRVLADNLVLKLKLKVLGRKIDLESETDIAKIYLLHQGSYLSNHLFKIMDQVTQKVKIGDTVTPWGWFIFTTGNFLNLALERVGLRALARVAHSLQDEGADEYYRLYEASVFKLITNGIHRLLRNQTELQRQLSYLKPEDREKFIKELAALEQNAVLSEEGATSQIQVLETEVFHAYRLRREERMDAISAAFSARAAVAKEVLRGAAGTIAAPFAPDDLQRKIPKISLPHLIRSCRTVLNL